MFVRVNKTMVTFLISKTNLGLSLLSIILTLLLLSSCSQRSNGQQNRGGGSGKGTVPVEAMIVHPQLLRNEIFTTGTLLANEEVELRSEISGRVVDVLFEEGKRVNKGELLLKINDTELQAQLKRISLEEKLASENERRQKSLFDIKGISQEDYDKYLSALQMIQADKEVISSQIAKTEIRAPFDGIIGLRYMSKGGYVTPDVLIATMQDINPIKVEFSVPEKHARQLKNGTEVFVRMGDLLEGRRGLIYAVESKIDLGTRTIKARAKIPNPDGKLIPGSYAKVEITLSELPDAIVIPSAAIVPQITGEMVYICKNGKAQSIAIKTGIRNEANVQISEGLAANDTLIVSGLLQLSDGKDIQITALKGP